MILRVTMKMTMVTMMVIAMVMVYPCPREVTVFQTARVMLAPRRA
jgi:hypothetical protein